MTVYWWILIYTTIISFVGSSITRTRQGNTNKNVNKSISLFMAILTFALLVYFVGFRSEFNDTYYYRQVYNGYITGDLSQIKDIWAEDSKSKYFNILQCLFKRFISKDYTVWFFFLAIFQIGAVIKLFYKYSCNYAMSSYLFITSTSFVWMMGGIRQFFAVCIVLYGFNYLIERKMIKFISLVLIASLFHVSALIWIPVYFICTSKPWGWRIILFVLGAITIIFSLDAFTNVLDNILADTNYEGLTNHFGSDDGVNPIRVLVSSVPWIIALLFRRRIEEENNLFLNISVNLSLISSAIYFIGMFTSGIIIGRLPMYFMLSNYILLPWLLDVMFKQPTKSIVKFACIVLYFAYFYYDMVIGGTGHYGSEVLGIAYT